MTQAATEADVARWRSRENGRDARANSGTAPATGEGGGASQGQMTAQAKVTQAEVPAQGPPVDHHFNAGMNPAGPTRVADNDGGRPDGNTGPAARDRGTNRDGR
jgi:hypothetical protein